MANLESTQLQNGFQTLVSIGTTTAGGHPSNPLLGALTNGKGNALTQVTLALGSVGAPSYSFTGDIDTGMFSSGADALGLVTNGVNRLAIDSSGNVGIGTTSFSSKLEVAGTIDVNTASSGLPTIKLSHTNAGADNFEIKAGTTGVANSGFSIRDVDAAVNRFVIDTNGNTAISGNLNVVGALSKGSGSFKIDHPLESKKDTHHLVHSFVESPQANNIYRGSVTLSDGQANINLDEVSTMTDGTFVALNTSIHVYTSNESDWDAVKGSVSGNILTIECQNAESNAMVNWLVIGERQDQHMIDTEWTDENGKVIVEPLK